jgi:hypothetical protein
MHLWLFSTAHDHKPIVGYECQDRMAFGTIIRHKYEGVGSVRDSIRVVGRGVCN